MKIPLHFDPVFLWQGIFKFTFVLINQVTPCKSMFNLKESVVLLKSAGTTDDK